MTPVIIELTDFKTKEVVDHLEVDAVLVATGRAPYTQVSPPRMLCYWFHKEFITLGGGGRAVSARCQQH